MALTSIGRPENAGFLGSHEIFGVWDALGISVVVNLLLSGTVVNNCRRKSPRQARRDKVHAATLDEVEMQQLQGCHYDMSY